MPVNAAGLFVSTLQVVLMPILAGLVLKKYFPAAVAFVLPACPLVAVFTVALICASVIGSSSAAIAAVRPGRSDFCQRPSLCVFVTTLCLIVSSCNEDGLYILSARPYMPPA